MTRPESIDAAKQALRAEMARRRSRLDASERETAAQALKDIGLGFAAPQPGAVVSGYAAIRDELDPLQLLTVLAGRGHPIALPVTVKKNSPLLFRQWRPGMALEAGDYSVPVPPASAPELEPDILLVPLLAFDRRGFRLGYGAGFYDRTLAELRAARSALAIGLAFEAQEVEKVPHDDYDEPLDWVLTPSGPIDIERV